MNPARPKSIVSLMQEPDHYFLGAPLLVILKFSEFIVLVIEATVS